MKARTGARPVTLTVLRPGVLSTVQDRGRHGLQHLGVVTGGAMDLIAHDIANALVGNPADLATLELTLLGPELQFADEALIALCGARFDAALDGSRLPLDRPVLVRAGSRLALGRALHGCRGYLAIAGGILVGQVLGSRSTYLPASFGGLAGRILRAGDEIPLAVNAPALARQRFEALGPGVAAGGGMRSVRWFAPPLTVISHPDHQFAVLPGRHYDRFTAKAQDALYESSWRVSPDSNRIGFRLTGPKLETDGKLEIISEPTCLGTVQVPANGTPIVLMADHQTTGGYPKIAEMASVDIPAFAQLAPGEELRFTRCTLEQARERRIAARSVLAAVIRSIATEYAK